MSQQRYRFVSDNDGHEYVIPTQLEAEFDAWLEDEERSTYDECDKYDEYRVDRNDLTFTDPQGYK